MTTDASLVGMPLQRRMRVAILGSGAGTTAQNLIEWGCKKGSSYKVELVISTSRTAGINTVASNNAVTLIVLDQSFSTSEWVDTMLAALFSAKIDIVALAGFMRMLPQAVIESMHGHVLNIHPALLPKHGGVGMYGRRVHEAVLQACDIESGATVHLVDGEYDSGRILGQAKVDVVRGETAQDLEKRVKSVERVLYPTVLNEYATELSFHVGNW